jgi:hypothetical protein
VSRRRRGKARGGERGEADSKFQSLPPKDIHSSHSPCDRYWHLAVHDAVEAVIFVLFISQSAGLRKRHAKRRFGGGALAGMGDVSTCLPLFLEKNSLNHCYKIILSNKREF